MGKQQLLSLRMHVNKWKERSP